MKRILISGKNSYIGTSFEKWVRRYDGYAVDTVDMIGDKWREYDFSAYDVVLHVAGIVHQKETKENADLYYKVNRDLAVEVANKARDSGVRQFILLSSMAVYGMLTGVIGSDTSVNPRSNYAKSKSEADMAIEKLSSDSFKVSILRPPMVYGGGCKGNYQLLRKAALRLPVFPNIRNQRSMLYIDNLCEFIKKIIDNEKSGYFHPQDYEYVCTADMVRSIAGVNGGKIAFTGLFNPIIKIADFTVIRKVFGSLIYEKQDYGFDYWVVKTTDEAINLTERD